MARLNHIFCSRSLCLVLVAALIVAVAAVGCKRATSIPADTAPSFSESVTIADQSYVVGQAIDDLTLPAASGGNGPLTYSLDTVPGLTFDMATRSLGGTPTTAGIYEMQYRVEDGDDNTADSDADTLAFTITVREPDTPAPVPPEEPDTAPSFADTASVADQSYVVGQAIDDLTLPAASGGNGALTYSLDTVPGLTFDMATRSLGGTPTTAGIYEMQYRVEDGDDNTADSDADTLAFSITVREPDTPAPVPPEEPDTAPSFADTASVADQSYVVGQAIDDLTLPAASGGNGPLTYSLDTVPGLTFDMATRSLGGTPTTAGINEMQYRVEDGDDNTTESDADTLAFTITVRGSETPDNAGTEWRLVRGSIFFRTGSEASRGTGRDSWRWATAGTIVHSSDGDRWTEASDSATSEWLRGVTGNGTRFVAVGSKGAIVHSSDGDRWTRASDSATSEQLQGVTWNGTRFVAVGGGGTGGSTIVYSSDGDRWTEASDIAIGSNLGGVTWSGTRFVAVGGTGTILHSSDGDRWTRASDSATGTVLQGVTWNGTRFVAVGFDGRIVHSSDGDRWTWASDSATSSDLSGVTWNGTRFVAVCEDGTIVHSRDGDRWTGASDRVTSGALRGVTWNGTRFVAVGDLAQSCTATMEIGGPRRVAVADWSGLEGVTWNGTRFVAVGERGHNRAQQRW